MKREFCSGAIIFDRMYVWLFINCLFVRHPLIKRKTMETVNLVHILPLSILIRFFLEKLTLRAASLEQLLRLADFCISPHNFIFGQFIDSIFVKHINYLSISLIFFCLIWFLFNELISFSLISYTFDFHKSHLFFYIMYVSYNFY